jgi:hypothetical protein
MARETWRTLQARARKICRAQPGYGTPHYRGDPYEAVALQQEAERLYWRGRHGAPLHVARQLAR